MPQTRPEAFLPLSAVWRRVGVAVSLRCLRSFTACSGQLSGGAGCWKNRLLSSSPWLHAVLEIRLVGGHSPRSLYPTALNPGCPLSFVASGAGFCHPALEKRLLEGPAPRWGQPCQTPRSSRAQLEGDCPQEISAGWPCPPHAQDKGAGSPIGRCPCRRGDVPYP